MAATTEAPALDVQDVVGGYGAEDILRGLSMKVGRGEVVLVLGANGAGKSTALKAIVSLIRVGSGRIDLFGEDVTGSRTGEIIRRGVAYVPQGGRVFRDMTVEENLLMANVAVDRPTQPGALEQTYEFFPILKSKRRDRAANLSGGQRQMVALARALISKPQLLILDEPSLGLAPKVVNELMERILAIRKELGITVLLSEQNAQAGLAIADRVYFMRLGQSIYQSDHPQADLRDMATLGRLYLA